MIGLVYATGMKTATEWHGLDQRSQVRWLACLDDLQVRAQAGIVAVSQGSSVLRVLNAWIALGTLPALRLAGVLAARAAVAS